MRKQEEKERQKNLGQGSLDFGWERRAGKGINQQES